METQALYGAWCLATACLLLASSGPGVETNAKKNTNLEILSSGFFFTQIRPNVWMRSKTQTIALQTEQAVQHAIAH